MLAMRADLFVLASLCYCCCSQRPLSRIKHASVPSAQLHRTAQVLVGEIKEPWLELARLLLAHRVTVAGKHVFATKQSIQNDKKRLSNLALRVPSLQRRELATAAAAVAAASSTMYFPAEASTLEERLGIDALEKDESLRYKGDLPELYDVLVQKNGVMDFFNPRVCFDVQMVNQEYVDYMWLRGEDGRFLRLREFSPGAEVVQPLTLADVQNAKPEEKLTVFMYLKTIDPIQRKQLKLGDDVNSVLLTKEVEAPALLGVANARVATR